MPKAVALVIPCFNEADRLDVAAFAGLVRARPRLRLVFVDDGSTDGTATVLGRLRSDVPGRVEILRLARNAGKAEAVRAGLESALGSGAEVVGYADADLATPPEEMLRMISDMERAPVPVLLGARVRLLGSRIARRPARHFAGRVFATIASLALRIPVYDTQCGAKLFLASEALRDALSRPFRSRWIFDVELLGRLLSGGPSGLPLTPADFRELPLQRWVDVRGSKLRPLGMVRAGLQLLAFLVGALFRRRSRRADGAVVAPADLDVGEPPAA